MLDEGQGKAFLARYGEGTQGTGWYSFDHGGVHFVALNSVTDIKPGGMAHIGDAQLSWCSATSRCGRSTRLGAVKAPSSNRIVSIDPRLRAARPGQVVRSRPDGQDRLCIDA